MKVSVLFDYYTDEVVVEFTYFRAEPDVNAWSEVIIDKMTCTDPMFDADNLTDEEEELIYEACFNVKRR